MQTVVEFENFILIKMQLAIHLVLIEETIISNCTYDNYRHCKLILNRESCLTCCEKIMEV